jgi:DNA-binding NarL/FixJ family response regulator
MDSLTIKSSVKIGVITVGVILIFESSNLFLVYKYFRFDYYLAAVASIFLVAGFLLSKLQFQKISRITVSKLPGLTNKELDILELIIEGKTNKEIAAQNFVEMSTIKTHINNLYAKLEVNNRREVINKYKNMLAKDPNY